MKTFKAIMLISLLLLFPAFSHSQNLGDLRISLIEGDVQIRTEDTGDWVPASINMPLVEGDRIWVPEGGKTELQLRDGTYLRLGERSALEILTLDRDSTQFYLDEGRAYVNFRGRKGSLLQMDTPISSIRSYERSVFRIDMSNDGLNRVSVFKGSVDAESREGRTTVSSGYSLTLKGDAYAELSPLGPPDDWERWNEQRDRKLAEWRPPPSYLPEELHAYSRDFEEYGRWVYVREYGYVWTPRIVVPIGWAPYRIGRWVWIAGDYVWISYEPWGWVPYHYGRWAFVASIGWCWVPPVRGAVFWGPGFVAWVRTPTYVAWVPLAPREIYYGRGHYGPHSVNITQVNVTNIQVNKVVYKNIHVHNAVTVIHHDTFVKGKHVDVKVKENLFLKEKISIGRPDIKPERATATPVIKEIPQARRPPEPIREIRVKELKEKRPFVKERNASVLRPESPPKEMTLKVKEGKPVEREFEKPRSFGATGRGIEKPQQSRPPERRIEQPRSAEKGMEKPKESKQPEKGVEKGKEFKPSEKAVEKPREAKPEERGVERPGEIKPAEKTVDRPKESRSPERGMEKPKEFRPPEGGAAKPKETRPSGRGSGKPEKGTEKLTEQRSVERGPERQRELQPRERGVERLREIKPPEKGVERPKESISIERRIEGSRPPEIGVERQKRTEGPRERQPAEKGTERFRESRPREKRIEKPTS